MCNAAAYPDDFQPPINPTASARTTRGAVIIIVPDADLVPIQQPDGHLKVLYRPLVLFPRA